MRLVGLRRAGAIGLAALFPAPVIAQSPRVELRQGERIAFLGGSLAERMNLFGHVETFLHLRFANLELVVRNFGWPADAVDTRQRPRDYTHIADPLGVFGPQTFVCFFGGNEAFGGAAGVESFEAAYHTFLDELQAKYRVQGAAPRVVLVSPIACEQTDNPFLPDAAERNADIARYAAAVQAVAAARRVPYADVFAPTRSLFEAEPGAQYTIDGTQLNEAGDRALAIALDTALFGADGAAQPEDARVAQVREAVVDKSWLHQQDYRMVNGWYVYGKRRTHDTETFPREYAKIRAMVARRDQRIWRLAAGDVAVPAPDDVGTGELLVPDTLFGTKRYSEPEELAYLEPEECIATMTTPEGTEVQLFASEREFPELANPVQLNFDDRGRLWVACMPTYPMWRPGDPRPSDRLLILEDRDGDGRADHQSVFYDQLHCPTGFEFWRDGVLVLDQPRLLFLRDTDGDDRADEVVRLLDGFATDDTHHAAGAWEWSHGGLLHMLEGISMSTTVETPWGPFRNRDTPGSYVFDPRAHRLSRFTLPGHANSWCAVFGPWSEPFIGDGTNASQHWATPFSGAVVRRRRTMDPMFDHGGMRPAVGNELLYSRHLPDELQGQFIFACVINMNGMPKFDLWEEGAGFRGQRVEDLVASTDKNFRPVDPQIGPDGALWFGDWCNALIGHMQYSQRDPNRDHRLGRIYRLVGVGRPPLDPAVQRGRTAAEVLEQLRAPELRTRYRARRALRAMPTPVLQAALAAWVLEIGEDDPDGDRLICEALWVQQSHHAVNRDWLARALAATRPQARAAAVRVLADEWRYVDDPMSLLRPALSDEHPRVRVEAVRALSFVPSRDAVRATLSAVEEPLDPWLSYTLIHTLKALEPVWRDVDDTEDHLFDGISPEAASLMADYDAMRGRAGAAVRPLRRLRDGIEEADARQAEMRAVAAVRGRGKHGEPVFRRLCMICHKVGVLGVENGPDLTKVSTRLNRYQLVESILDPNATLAEGYATVVVRTRDGRVVAGFVAAEDDDSVTLRPASGMPVRIVKANILDREEIQASSMPENLSATMSPAEFVDLIEYLSHLK
ncbi:MAG: PVC-type heme-binding CxxCH protein [Planctomycetota bacterium]